MDKKQIIDEFIKSVMYVHEIEYGDFKRKLGLYINRLEQTLQNKSDKSFNYFTRLRELVIYNPNGDIDLTRSMIIEETNKVKRDLMN